MILYLIFALVALVTAILFSLDKYPLKGYKECVTDQAKKTYRQFGIVTCYTLTLGFVFMALYDLSINQNNEMIVLEGFGLALLLIGVIVLVFGLISYHNKLNDYTRSENENKNEFLIRQRCENKEEDK